MINVPLVTERLIKDTIIQRDYPEIAIGLLNQEIEIAHKTREYFWLVDANGFPLFLTIGNKRYSDFVLERVFLNTGLRLSAFNSRGRQTITYIDYVQ